MSIISSKSGKSKEGFIPYQSQSGDLRQISLFSRLNLNDEIELERPLPHENIFNKSSSDLLSVGSKKRKLSQQLIQSSKVGGNKTFLNRSFVGKSSLNGQLMLEMQSNYSHLNEAKKEISENSCPIILNNSDHDDIFSSPQRHIEEKPRFTKTKNLLRNMSNYMHKFILYNKRGDKWVRDYFKSKLLYSKRKISIQKSSLQVLSNRSQGQGKDLLKLQEFESPPIEEREMKEEQKEKEKSMKNQVISAEKQCEEMGEQLQQKINTSVRQFMDWISELSIVNFNDYQQVWTRPHKFKALYRVMCYKYYKNEAYCDIMRSRLTTKDITIKYLPQFIEGILQPSQFCRFK